MQISKPTIIAGPCSVESPEQLIATARALRSLNIDCFRGGVWKPRTRPGSFEGVGDEGLKWLKSVQDEIGMEVCTEVATAEHVRKCLKAGIKNLWIGARTTVNPFQVQEIADALSEAAGRDEITVLVKNPVCADLSLWVGAVERIQLAGIRSIILIYRGVPSLDEKLYRNAPQWAFAAQMQARFPEYPLLCDASHIAGDRQLVEQISRKAMSLGLDGLMIEVHANPCKALSDAQQQLDPQEFAALLETLTCRDPQSTDIRLETKRHEIDSIDREIIDALSRRMQVSQEIGKIKAEASIPVIQTGRWKEVLEKIVAQGAEKGLDAQFLQELYTIIHNASIGKQ